jgi:hypothetical protein
MKKNLIPIIIFATAIFFACKKSAVDNTLQNQSNNPSFSLKAPNGFQIAQNTTELKALLASSVNRKFQTDNLEYDITDIKYAITKSGGVISDIEYKTKNGMVTNVILMQDVKEKITSTGDVRVVIDDKYIKDYPSPEAKTMSVHKYSCSGPECSKVHALEHPDGSVDVDCSCSGCTMTIE